MRRLLRRPRAATLVAALTLALSALVLVVPAQATTTVIRGHDASDLAVAVSDATVPAGSAETAVIVADDDPALLQAAASVLGGLPRPTPLLLTRPDHLDKATFDALERATGGPSRYEGVTVTLVGDVADRVSQELEAHGYTVLPTPAADPASVAVALANATYGSPGGTSQRVVLADASDPFAVAAADAYGVNVGVPVIPVDGDVPDLGVFLRQVIVVAPAEAIGDAAAAHTGTGSPTVTRIWDDDHTALSAGLAHLLAAEQGEGNPTPAPHAVAPVVASGTTDPAAGALASMVAERAAWDGNDAPLLLATDATPEAMAHACDGSGSGDASCPIDGVDGNVTALVLPGDGAPAGGADVVSAGARLPTTGGGRAGLALGMLLAGGALSAWLRRRHA